LNSLPNSLSTNEQNQLFRIIKRNFINVYRIIYQISQPESDSFKSRNTYYHNEKHPNPKDSSEEGTCCQAFFSKIYIPNNKQTPIEQCISLLLSRSEFLVFSKTLLEKLAETFFRIKNNGIKDKLPWDLENERYVLHEVLKEGVQNEMFKEIKKRLLREQKVDSKQPGLFATPSVWEKQFPGIPLDFLTNETIEALVKRGFAFQRDFMKSRDFVRDLHKELNYLSLEGKFEEIIQETAESRKDRCLWLNLSEIEKENFGSLHRICNALAGIPYELNKKNSGFFSQISETFQLSYFPEKAYQKAHLDSSSLDARDNGKLVTFLYFCNVDPDFKREFGKIKVFPKVDMGKEGEEINQEGSEEILMEWDGLLAMKSRKVAYEVLENEGGKKFVVRFWANGPRDFLKQDF